MFGDIVVPVNLCDLDLFELQKLISGRYQIAPPPSVSQYCGELFPKRILNPIIEVEEEDEENSKSPETLDTPTPIIQNPTIVNLLSFDSDGFRCFASLRVLNEIMSGINASRPAESQLLPRDVFQVIAGTELGGIVAILLVSFNMSASQALYHFEQFCKRHFDTNFMTNSLRRLLRSSFSSDIIGYRKTAAMEYMSDLCDTFLRSRDIKFSSTSRSECTAIIAITKIPKKHEDPNSFRTVLLSTFADVDNPHPDLTILEVVRLTIATPGLVSSVVVDRTEYTNGAIFVPNPSNRAAIYAKKYLFGSAHLNIVNISSGILELEVKPTSLTAALGLKRGLSWGRQSKHSDWHDVQQMIEIDEGGSALRFVVPGIEIRRIQWHELHHWSRVEEALENYVAAPEYKEMLGGCIEKISEGYSQYRQFLEFQKRV